MSKGEELTTTKYLIYADINANGVVEKPDVVGAIFGQTEGLLSNDLDLRELQRTGRIGRIQVIIHSNGGRAKGEIVIPSSLDRIETAILAASLETINRVGPCEANIKVNKVEDVRAVKRQQVVNRAKEIYKGMMDSVTPASMQMIEEVREAMRVHEISEFGEERLPAGPSVHTSDAIIVVEGRNDVLNLLKYGIKNTVAVEGVNVPKSIADLTKKRTVTVFVDGDRGGELILKELLQVGDVDFVTRAPVGKEVEDLEKDEVITALRDKTPIEQFLATTSLISNSDVQNKKSSKKSRKNNNHSNNNQKYNQKNNYKSDNDYDYDDIVEQPDFIVEDDDEISLMKDMLREIEGSGTGEILDNALNLMKEVSVEELYNEVQHVEDNAETIIFDGVVSQRLIDASYKKGIKNIVAFKAQNIVKKPHGLKVITLE
ncbi:MAG: DNA primase DnaG [Methanobrevibacter sp.]